MPVRLEHEYQRKGALNLVAVFDTRSGEVIGLCRRRKRQVEIIELLEEVDSRLPAAITAIHVVYDNVRTHSGKLVRAWLQRNPRFQFHFTLVHCSWMNQIEQWFSIIQRKRLVAPRFDEWNQAPHGFAWSRQSFAKVLGDTQEESGRAAA